MRSSAGGVLGLDGAVDLVDSPARPGHEERDPQQQGNREKEQQPFHRFPANDGSSRHCVGRGSATQGQKFRHLMHWPSHTGNRAVRGGGQGRRVPSCGRSGMLSGAMQARAIRIIGIDPGLQAHRLGHRRGGRRAPQLRRQRPRHLRRRGGPGLPPARHLRGADGRDRQLPAAGGRGRGDLRQQGCARNPEARPGARHGAAGARRRGACASPSIRPTSSRRP